MFNDVEAEMAKVVSASVVQRESEWRDHLARHATSGKSVAAFCRSESLSEGSFYTWRRRLQGDGSNGVLTPSPAALAPFIDLGVVNNGVADDRAPRADRANKGALSSIEVRIDLGGVVLTITRH